MKPNVSGPVLNRANISYELAERTKAVAHGGMGTIVRLVAWTGLASEIDASLPLLKIHGIGAESLPDPTTAGDFCRRFSPEDVMALQEAINRARLAVFAAQPSAFFAKPAVIEADAWIAPTDGETKDGMDIAYNGVWGTPRSW